MRKRTTPEHYRRPMPQLVGCRVLGGGCRVWGGGCRVKGGDPWSSCRRWCTCRPGSAPRTVAGLGFAVRRYAPATPVCTLKEEGEREAGREKERETQKEIDTERETARQRDGHRDGERARETEERERERGSAPRTVES